MTLKILVADDEPHIREVVQLYLEREGFYVYVADDGEEALELEAKTQPDLLILDIMLPKLSGWDICRSLQRKVPVIFLTAKSTENDKIIGFSLGADDYVTKPFSPRELVARIKAVMRRAGMLGDPDQVLAAPGLSIRPCSQIVECAGQSIQLTPKETELLLFFIRHPKSVFSRDQLLNNIWGYDFAGDDRTVDTTIKRLRQKLSPAPYTYIQTVWGLGYKFEVVPK